jgi:hypothetical protein
MKKQILILAFLVLAIFASVNKSYGQAVHHNKGQVLSCPNDPLHPMAGKQYIYDVNSANSTDGTYTWWVTKDVNFIVPTYTPPTTNASVTNVAGRIVVSPTTLLSASANYGVATATVAPATSPLTLSWSSTLLNATKYQAIPADAPKTSTFVVAHYQSTGAANCSDNMKIYEISPINGFTVDIKNIKYTSGLAKTLVDADTLAFGVTDVQCVDLVRGATYNVTNHGIDFDYGKNYLYFEVIASNFSVSWLPSFKISGLNTTQEAKIEWDYSLAFTTPNVVAAAAVAADNGTLLTGTAFTVPASPALSSLTSTSNGASIYVRVTVSNKTYETLADNAITLSVNGTTAGTDFDVVNDGAPDDCTTTAIADWTDNAIQTIKRRPTITENTVTIPAAGAPQDIIPNNP